MISCIDLQFGAGTDQPRLQLRPPTLTVFVGPNNSGKSTALREINSILRHPDPLIDFGRIVNRLHVEPPPTTTVIRLLQQRGVRDPHNPDRYQVRGRGPRPDAPGLNTEIIGDRVPDFEHRPAEFFRQLLACCTVSLDGRTRLELGNQQTFETWRTSNPVQHWSALYRQPETLREMSQIVFDAFELHLGLDTITNPGHILPRLSRRPIPDAIVTQSGSREAFEFFSSTPQISDFSDGVKAFCGVVGELLAGDDLVILIDEPDAFLHPPLSRALAEHIARLAARRRAQVLVATHSSHFIFGAVSAGINLAIVRFTHDGKASTARVLDENALSALMRDPLVRTTGVLDGLFHRSVVVCEGHSDRVFYDEINARLRPIRGIQDSLFLNAGGWHNVGRLIAPLRRLGIPAAGIVDLDSVRKREFTDLMESAGIPDAVRHGARQIAGDLCRSVEQRGGNLKAGLPSMQGHERASGATLIQLLERYGLYLVPVGELESWLPRVAQGATKDDWIRTVLTNLGSLPTDADYVAAGDDDVWQFLDRIGSWTKEGLSDGDPANES